ncbi:Phosphoribosylformylglycinamidine synthetase PurS [Prochlorococcus marinus str. MIT 9515]|uniref:Phosphoribosylformylglycinamidine synthase subunit PurS n=1 Tax=Prochlorococcus marinus (strain MIT 9515) TaxID=167542 RepID=A2BW51_PROM5|nr:phosphoribosylformylglycinamidine synthase subunit PurS [Prochlorococcus marinus]ABM72012.1 Phosphoribosylformylglycinamidine synthetase PurS [Prochlorococcus marinus str. MIT 9515]
MDQFEVKVFIRLRPSVLDPAGEAIKSASSKLGVEGIKSLRIGKMIEVKIEGNKEGDIKEKIDILCDRLFANTVIEDFEYSIKKL